MTIKEEQEKLVSEFREFSDWEDKYTAIIKMGKEMSEFPEEYRVEKNKIHGCQSQVWMNAKLDEGKVIIEADSDAMIVKGLIAMLVKVYSQQTPKDILSNPPDFVKQIGIDNHLSPTRKNGLGAMLKQIQMYALAFSTITKWIFSQKFKNKNAGNISGIFINRIIQNRTIVNSINNPQFYPIFSHQYLRKTASQFLCICLCT